MQQWQKRPLRSLIGSWAIALLSCGTVTATEPPPATPPVPTQSSPASDINTVEQIARETTVRILTPKSSGSGVIVQQQGDIYTVLTNWHVLAFSPQYTILAPDGRRYTPLIAQTKRLGTVDLAIAQFRSSHPYRVAQITPEAATAGETVFAAGFPMYQDKTLTPTFTLGLQAFHMSEGIVSLLPPKSLNAGYRLGYSNDIAVGMSGGPIFNSAGLLIGINGRLKHRDPDFGVYTFEDGTEPDPELLEQMVQSSWGIPIHTYLQLSHQEITQQ